MRIILAGLVLLCLFVSGSYACDETVRVGDSTYAIDDIWCGKKMDSTFTPKFEDLKKIPDSFSFQQSKIYIRTEACEAFVKMARAALKDSVFLIVQSGYRSQGYQAKLVKDRMVKGESFAKVIRYVAPPGYSEHQTGYAVDLKSPGTLFSKSKPYAWLQKHAVKYGFIERYPKDNSTLKSYEPWHWTYVGEGSLLKE